MPQQEARTTTQAAVTGHRCLCLLLGLVLVTGGCASGASQKSSSLKSAKNVKSSAAELSSRNQSLLAIYSGEIEAAADKIILESPLPATRRQALVWKAEAIPVLQSSMLKTDPVAAGLDTWVFVFQMMAFMKQPAVQQRFGDFHSVVDETINRMDTEMEQLVRTSAPQANVADLRQKANAWAQAHPIQTSLAGRQSVDAEVIRQAKQADMGAVASIRALQESMGDLTARLDSYNVYAPKQARWQAELLLIDLTREPAVGAAMSNFTALSSAAVKASSSMEGMPDLLEHARAAVLADIDNQRLAAQAFLREERTQVLDQLQRERIATVANLRGERLAATADLRGERQIVLDALHNEQVATIDGLHGISEEALKNFDSRARGLIDHFFLRTLELMLLTLVLISLVAWILLRRFGHKRLRGEKIYDRAA